MRRNRSSEVGFSGIYPVSMDENGRTAIPKKLREACPLGTPLSAKTKKTGIYFISRWAEGCLGLFLKDEWVRRLALLAEGTAAFKEKNRIVTRHLVGSAFKIKPDSLGRITIPKPLISAAELSGEIWFVGQINHIEIWNPGKYERILKDKMTFEQAAEELFGK